MNGDLPITTPREQFELVDADSLPVAHNPFRCVHRRRLRKLEDSVPRTDWDPYFGRRPAAIAITGVRVGFDQSLTAGDLAACPYHTRTGCWSHRWRAGS